MPPEHLDLHEWLEGYLNTSLPGIFTQPLTSNPQPIEPIKFQTELDFESLFETALGELISRSGGNIDEALSSLGIIDSDAVTEIKEWYGWDAETVEEVMYCEDRSDLQYV